MSDTENATPGALPADATNDLAVVEQEDEATEGKDADGEQATEGNGEGKPDKPALTDDQKAIRSLQRRIGRLTNEKALLAAEAELARRQTAEQQAAPKEPSQLTEEEIERRVQEIASQRVKERSFSDQANRFVEDGRKAFKGFDTALRTVAEEVGGLLDNHGNPTALAAAIMDAEKAKPHEIVKYLAENQELAAELGMLSPLRQIRRIAQIEVDLSAKPQPKPSGAPKPVTPVKGSGVISDEPDPKDSEHWIKWRNKNADR